MLAVFEESVDVDGICCVALGDFGGVVGDHDCNDRFPQVGAILHMVAL